MITSEWVDVFVQIHGILLVVFAVLCLVGAVGTAVGRSDDRRTHPAPDPRWDRTRDTHGR